MKEITFKRYVCEVCGKEYDDEDICEACEKRHSEPSKIVWKTYEPGASYPEYIRVLFEDGGVREYKLTESNI